MKRIQKNFIYIILFIMSLLGIMLLELVVRVKAIHGDYNLYTIIFCVLMLFLIAFSLIIPLSKKHQVKLRFHMPLLICWLAMCFFMLYSDIVIPKKYCYLSLILLVLFTTLFIIWQQYRIADRDKLWSFFRISVEIAFCIATIFCFLFRPYQNGIRYSGLSANPNIYAMFLVTVWACLITRLDFLINDKAVPVKCIFTYAEFGCALFFMYMTGARTSFLAVSFMTFIWFCFRLFFCRKSGQKIIGYVLVGIGCMTVSFVVSFALLATVPHIINHPIAFGRDRAFASIDTESSICLAASESDKSDTITDVENAIKDVENEPSLIKRISLAFQNGSDLDTILNGRLSIYKEYISKIDNIGHKKYGKKVNGIFVVNAHNNAIQIAYTYGRPAMIAYILLCLLSIICSIRFYIISHNNRKNAALPMLITAGFIMTSLTECILLPMQSLLAFAFYLSVGELMNAQKK